MNHQQSAVAAAALRGVYPRVDIVASSFNNAPAVMVKRSELVERIRNMIVIVKDYEEREMLKHIMVPTIPYYLVGLDAKIESRLRSYFAEMIFVAAFELGEERAIAGWAISRLANVSRRLQAWLNDAPRFTQAERDWLSYWCNPVVIARNGDADKVSMAAWSNGIYLDGVWAENYLTPTTIKQLVKFNDNQHMVVYDHN